MNGVIGIGGVVAMPLALSLAVAAPYLPFPLTLAMVFPDGPPTRGDVAFQLTLPGLEEELFYRGLLLLALDRTFTGRVRRLGIDWGWGAILSSFLFGLAHAFSYGRGGFAFDPLFFALTGPPSLVAVWLRLRSGSLAWPVAIHNAGNCLSFLV